MRRPSIRIFQDSLKKISRKISNSNLLRINITEKLEQYKEIESDINEHLNDLYVMAQGGSVTEFGVRAGVSTTAFIAGSSTRVYSYDILHHPDFDLEYYVKESKSTGVDFKFTIADVLGIEIDETDILFIDTWHTYEQLKAEFEKHHSRVRKAIVVHDTETFGEIGEDGEAPGLKHAIREFCDSHSEWKVCHHKIINNGLTVLNKTNDSEFHETIAWLK